LSRNCFRGTEEAFAYAPVAEDLTRTLVDEFLVDDQRRTLPGAFYPPYLAFLLVPLMHSEDLPLHTLGLTFVARCQERYAKDIHLANHFALERQMLLDHTQVLEQFGRYPHRNGKLGRPSTVDEQRWLDDTDQLPDWAKSQG
jgi:uncharacterized protein (DUF924 family)